MRISDWSSDVCSSDLAGRARGQPVDLDHARVVAAADRGGRRQRMGVEVAEPARAAHAELAVALGVAVAEGDRVEVVPDPQQVRRLAGADEARHARSEEHTSELQSLMRISYAACCL